MSIAHKIRDDHGAVSLEVIMLAPAILIVLALIIGFARVGQANMNVDSAAYAAARAASISRTPGEASGSAREAAQDVLTQKGLDCPADVAVDTSAFNSAPGESGAITVTVTCPVPLGDLAVPGLPGTRTVTGEGSSVLDRYRGRQ